MLSVAGTMSALCIIARLMTNIIQEENRCKFVFVYIWICELKVSDLNVPGRIRNRCPIYEIYSRSFLDKLYWIFAMDQKKKGEFLPVNPVVTSHSTVGWVLVWTWCFSYNAYVSFQREEIQWGISVGFLYAKTMCLVIKCTSLIMWLCSVKTALTSVIKQTSD